MCSVLHRLNPDFIITLFTPPFTSYPSFLNPVTIQIDHGYMNSQIVKLSIIIAMVFSIMLSYSGYSAEKILNDTCSDCFYNLVSFFYYYLIHDS